MAADVVELLDSVDRAVVASEGIVAPASVARAEVRTGELRAPVADSRAKLWSWPLREGPAPVNRA